MGTQKNRLNETVLLSTHGSFEHPEHLLKLMGKRVFTILNLKFHNHSFLNTHIRTHSAARPYKCETCEKCYSSSTNLNRHTKESHSNDPDLVKKPIQCQMCKCWCANKLTFKSHLQFHHGYTLGQVKDI